MVLAPGVLVAAGKMIHTPINAKHPSVQTNHQFEPHNRANQPITNQPLMQTNHHRAPESMHHQLQSNYQCKSPIKAIQPSLQTHHHCKPTIIANRPSLQIHHHCKPTINAFQQPKQSNNVVGSFARIIFSVTGVPPLNIH